MKNTTRILALLLCFCLAVGRAHLLGDGGLVHALRDAGFTVALIDPH